MALALVGLPVGGLDAGEDGASLDDSAWSCSLPEVFEQAAGAYQVPVDLLVVLGWMGSGLEDRGELATLEGGYGLMAIRANAWCPYALWWAAQWTGVALERVIREPAANIRGAAALLSLYADEADVDRGQGIEAWVDVVIRYAALDDAASRLFAAEVYEKLAGGLHVTNSRGETFTVEARPLSFDPRVLAPPGVRLLSADYSLAMWDPAPSCNFIATDVDKNAIVIHTLEGTAAGALARFKQCGAPASVHYIVSESGAIWQMVRESQMAWHVGCDERRTIGIAHEGFAAAASHSDAMVRASTRLAKAICERWGIPKRRVGQGGAGITGHDALNACCCHGPESDPGPGWPWGDYLSLVNGGKPAPVVISAVSRKHHGPAGDFDLDLLAGPAVETREGGPTQLIVTFDQSIEGADGLDPGDVYVSAGRVERVAIQDRCLTVETSGVPDGVVLTVTFPGIARVGGMIVTGELRLGVLTGDTNGDGCVDVMDLLCTRDQMHRPVGAGNCRHDTYVSGCVDIADLIYIRDRLGQALPAETP